ncbi:unnamed protein product, partial [Schistosoma turkestanicum]
VLATAFGTATGHVNAALHSAAAAAHANLTAAAAAAAAAAGNPGGGGGGGHAQLVTHQGATYLVQSSQLMDDDGSAISHTAKASPITVSQ